MLPQKHILSKSTFMYGCQCHKRLWLHKHRPKLKDDLSAQQAARFQQGTDVGLLAQQLFTGGIDASPMQAWNYRQSVLDTQQYLRQGHQVLYEAAFQYEGMLCAVDLLVKTTKGWVAYEVKSSLSLKREHIQDAALQYFVITNSGLDLADMVVVHLDKSYVRKGNLELKKLFRPVTLLPNVKVMQERIAARVSEFKEVITNETIPGIQTGEHCMSPYPCDFLGFCHEKIFAGPEENEVQIKKENVFISLPADEIKETCFLNIVTWRNAVPLTDGHWPYRQVPFLWSVTKTEDDGAISYILSNKLDRISFFISDLKKQIPTEGQIFVADKKSYHYLFQDLKKDHPEEVEFLSTIQERIADIRLNTEIDALEILATFSKENIFSGLALPTAYDASVSYFNLNGETSAEEKNAVLEAAKKYGEAVVKTMKEIVTTEGINQ